MSTTFGFFLDAGLTQPASSGMTINQADDGSTGAVDVQLWFGSTASGKKAQADSNPGVDNIVISIADSAPGTGQATSAVKLALTEGGLDTATAGAALDLGVTQVLSGTSNAVSLWARIQASLLTIGTYTDLSLQTVSLFESAV